MPLNIERENMTAEHNGEEILAKEKAMPGRELKGVCVRQLPHVCMTPPTLSLATHHIIHLIRYRAKSETWIERWCRVPLFFFSLAASTNQVTSEINIMAMDILHEKRGRGISLPPAA
jgi:hypothetical protein